MATAVYGGTNTTYGCRVGQRRGVMHVEVFKVLVLDRLGSVSSTIQFLWFGGKAVVFEVLSQLVGLLTDRHLGRWLG